LYSYKKNLLYTGWAKKKCPYPLNAHISQTIQAIAMKKQPNQRPFNSLSNDVWFHGHLSHRNGQNDHLKKMDLKKKVSTTFEMAITRERLELSK